MPASVDMHFRNGAVAISYISTLLLGPDGSYVNGGDTLFRQIGAFVAPDDAPPVLPGNPPPGY
ncbi:hypothetical protein [Jongsikchunia kroppenstedtii]|uniref:hypothetical protein n=1 Tax=Jongsikchunia kroppenstedtii TaxID=1121721 RepID=UPI000380EB2A|nr:hypothetical protein [Jongsikchunia kroppenstedtii]